jgi:hypothetical protein
VRSRATGTCSRSRSKKGLGRGILIGCPDPLPRGGAINYIHIDMLRYQAQELQELEAHQRSMPCEGLENMSSCEQPAEYLMPDATRPGSGGSDIEIRPAWFCRRHLSMLLGRDPGEQPHLRHIEGSKEQSGFVE